MSLVRYGMAVGMSTAAATTLKVMKTPFSFKTSLNAELIPLIIIALTASSEGQDALCQRLDGQVEQLRAVSDKLKEAQKATPPEEWTADDRTAFTEQCDAYIDDVNTDISLTTGKRDVISANSSLTEFGSWAAITVAGYMVFLAATAVFDKWTPPHMQAAVDWAKSLIVKRWATFLARMVTGRLRASLASAGILAGILVWHTMQAGKLSDGRMPTYEQKEGSWETRKPPETAQA